MAGQSLYDYCVKVGINWTRAKGRATYSETASASFITLMALRQNSLAYSCSLFISGKAEHTQPRPNDNYWIVAPDRWQIVSLMVIVIAVVVFSVFEPLGFNLSFIALVSEISASAGNTKITCWFLILLNLPRFLSLLLMRIMKNLTTKYLSLLILLTTASISIAQEKHHYQTDFQTGEFAERREKIFNAIGSNSIALIQGSNSVTGFSVFRQSNTFYYLCGLETAHSYLLLNGKNKKSTLYLPHRDEGRERSQGKILSAEDAELVKQLTGIDRVRGLEFLSSDLVGSGLIKPPAPILYTPLSPAETGNDSRDELLHGQARVSSDPWDGQASREARFQQLLIQRFPQFEIRDLSPILDSMRLIKDQKEIEMIRKATQIAGLGIIEAMRSTSPGVYEYQLDAAAKYIFYLNGAQGDGYASIIGGGTNAFMGHYFHKTDVLNDGDLVLMDYAPDYAYYTSDVTRIWPVNGKYDDAQRALYNYIVAYRDALFRYVRPGITSDEVLDQAAMDMKKYLEGKSFANPAHLKAVQKGVGFRGHFQHPVGMAVHDVGGVHRVPLQPGMVFTIDPMIWIPEERLYIRIEDMALVTEDGVENLSDFVPSSINDVERTIKEKGLIEFRPATKSLLNK